MTDIYESAARKYTGDVLSKVPAALLPMIYEIAENEGETSLKVSVMTADGAKFSGKLSKKCIRSEIITLEDARVVSSAIEKGPAKITIFWRHVTSYWVEIPS